MSEPEKVDDWKVLGEEDLRLRDAIRSWLKKHHLAHRGFQAEDVLVESLLRELSVFSFEDMSRVSILVSALQRIARPFSSGNRLVASQMRIIAARSLKRFGVQ